MNKIIFIILQEDGKYQIRLFEPETEYETMKQEIIKEFGMDPEVCPITESEVLAQGYDLDAIAKELDEMEADDE